MNFSVTLKKENTQGGFMKKKDDKHKPTKPENKSVKMTKDQDAQKATSGNASSCSTTWNKKKK